jgi:hypothetical protein
MISRTLLLFALLLPGALSASIAVSAATWTADTGVLSIASERLGHESASKVIQWLGQQPAIRSAWLGRDARTVDIRFRDGVGGAILPGTVRAAAIGSAPTVRRIIPDALPHQSSGARAAVLEPFASELGLGSFAGQPEVDALQAAGFTVDQANDTGVSIGTFASLAQYNVVYMHTHSGYVGSQWAVASGEQVNGDPTVQPYLQDGSVIYTGVAGGGGRTWYAITSSFVTKHMGRFASKAILFINGCDLLNSSDFWQAFSNQGAGAMISWNGLGAAKDDYLSAAAFFSFMRQGQTISQAMSNTYSAGYGSSSGSGQSASMGFVGDGSITLGQAASSRPSQVTPTSTSPPTVTATVPAAATPTGTIVPTATSTDTPLPPTTQPTDTPTETPTPTLSPTPTTPLVTPSLSLASSVSPGSRQTLAFHFMAGATVHFTVAFPNGDRKLHTSTAGGQGNATYSFSQHSSEITRENDVATVTVDAQVGEQTAETQQRYHIGFGKIDVSAEPRRQAAGRKITIYVHTHARTGVELTVATSHPIHLSSVTGTHGWTHFSYRLSHKLRTGRKVVVRASFHSGQRTYSTETTFAIT